MRITEVALEDIKSYGDRTVVPIEGGVTAILGENGAGKSTIQEAVGFALFDSLPFNNGEFVREGASSGTVEVTFEQESATARQRFRVTRSAGRSSYGVDRYDFDGEEWLDQDIDTKSELVGWLCARFDVEDGDELRSLWESCIGVPQTRFLSDFAQRPASRTATFDGLLNIDAYEESWSRLKDVPNTIESDRRDLREEIVGLTSSVQSLPDERAKAESLADELEEIEAAIDRKSDELAEKEAEHEELESVQEEIDGLEQEVSSLEQEIGATERELETAEDELRDAEEAQRKCEANREGYHRHEEANERLDELEQREEQRDRLLERRNEQQQAVASVEFAVEQLTEDAETLEAARETLESREGEKERYEELDEKVSALYEREDEVEQLRGEVREFDDAIDAKRGEVEALETKIEAIENEWEATTHPQELDDEINDRKARRRQLKSERERLEEQLERLRDTDVDAPCPTCDRPLNEKHRSEAIEQRDERIAAIETEREKLGEKLSALHDRREEARDVKRRADKLPVHREKIESLEAEIDELQEGKQETETELEALEGKLAELPGLEAERDELKEAYEAYRTAEFRVNENADVPDELAEKRAERDAANEELEEIDDELEGYEGLDEKLATITETLAETEPAYRTYIKHDQQASQLEKRRETVETVEGELAELEAERDGVESELETTRASFDEERLETLTSTIDDLKGAIERTKGSLEEKRRSLDEARGEVERLEAKVEERREKLQRLKELQADQQFAEWVRENVREAGPKMREIITSRVGTRANELFRTIRGASAETLEWTSEYEIVVHDADVRKSFSTLSGGEKMAAALAVRLAILEQLASVGVAFLDEPTANLDRRKKRNLVQQLQQLDSFEQLTVISHDETFDSMTDYTVSVAKDRQTSEVTVN